MSLRLACSGGRPSLLPGSSGPSTAHCASVRPARSVTTKVATRSPCRWSSSSLTHLPETSPVTAQRHAGTSRSQQSLSPLLKHGLAALVLLNRPHVPVRVFEEAITRARRALGPHLLHLADTHSPPDQFAADRIEVLDHQLDSFDRAGLAQRQALTDHHRACRAGRGHLYHPHGLVWPRVVIEVEADLAGIKVFGGIDIAYWNGNDLKLHVHEASR